MCHFFQSRIHILPLIILDETIENDVAVPAGFAEVLAYLLLNGRRDEARAIAILIIIGVAMLAASYPWHTSPSQPCGKGNSWLCLHPENGD